MMIISRLGCFFRYQIWILFKLLRFLRSQLLSNDSLLFTSLFLVFLLKLSLHGFLLDFLSDNLVILFLG